MIELDKIKYKKKFLSNVLVRIDFSPILILKDELKAEFQESIRKQFPIFETQRKIEHFIDIKENLIEEKPFTQWILISNDLDRKIFITFNSAVVEFYNYSNFEEFNEIVLSVMQNLVKFYGQLNIKRFGLRYINKIKLPSGDPYKWSEFIEQPLTYSLDNFIKNKNELSRSMNQMIFNKIDHLLQFTYGIFNDEFPSKISRKEYILDFDCYSKEVEESDIKRKIKNFHDDILELFDNSITKKLKEIMEPIK